MLRIPGVTSVAVSVNRSLPTVGPVAWEITFPHRKARPGTDPDDPGSFIATGQAGDRRDLRVVRSQLRGEGARAEALTLRDGTAPIGGRFDVQILGDTEVATLTARASAASVRAGLVEKLGLPAETEVVRAGPLDDALAYTWTVSVPVGTSLFDAEAGESGRLLLNQSNLVGKNATVRTSLVQRGNEEVGGFFNLSLGGASLSLPHNATPTEMRDAIASFPASGGNVSVSSTSRENLGRSVAGTRRFERGWAVTFLSLAAAGDVPTIDINDSELTGSGVGILANETTKGITADLQMITVAGYNGSFSLISSSREPASNSSSPELVLHSSLLQWDASASDLSTAVYEVTGKQAYVERLGPSSDGNGYSWLVLFAEELSDTWGTIELNASGLVPHDTAMNGSAHWASLTSVRNSTAIPLGGSFTLGFGQRCSDRAAGIFCSGAETSEIPYDASAWEVEEAIETIPAILDASVTGDGYMPWYGTGKPAPDGIGVASTGVRFRVTLNEVVLNASDASLSEYWSRTWSPRSAAADWSGDLMTEGNFPLVSVDVAGVSGSAPKRRVTEITRGRSRDSGGVVALEVSQNAGRDYTSSGVTYVFEPLVMVERLIPDHGPAHGGTEVRLQPHQTLLWEHSSASQCSRPSEAGFIEQRPIIVKT